MENKDVLELVKEFVKQKCKERDESHGYEHMKIVAKRSLYIFDREYARKYPDLRDRILVIAWLHDVADPKYDSSLRDDVENILVKIFGEKDGKSCMTVIDRISWSKEVKVDRGLDVWLACGSPDYEIIRNIVSDADKIEALGEIGLKRCIEYTMAKNPEYTKEQLKEHVKQHAEDKLLRLPLYIRTFAGLELAKEAYDDFQKHYQRFLKE